MATIKDFEERHDFTWLDGKMFVDLWQDNRQDWRFFITNDFNVIERFCADSKEDAIKKFREKRGY